MLILQLVRFMPSDTSLMDAGQQDSPVIDGDPAHIHADVLPLILPRHEDLLTPTHCVVQLQL